MTPKSETCLTSFLHWTTERPLCVLIAPPSLPSSPSLRSRSSAPRWRSWPRAQHLCTRGNLKPMTGACSQVPCPRIRASCSCMLTKTRCATWKRWAWAGRGRANCTRRRFLSSRAAVPRKYSSISFIRRPPCTASATMPRSARVFLKGHPPISPYLPPRMTRRPIRACSRLR